MNAITFKNAESPFTELFALFQQCDISSKMNSVEEIDIINQHINNAIEILCQGLQTLGRLMGSLQNSDTVPADVMNIGYFVAVVCNLAEALNVLRVDLDYIAEVGTSCKDT